MIFHHLRTSCAGTVEHSVHGGNCLLYCLLRRVRRKNGRHRHDLPHVADAAKDGQATSGTRSDCRNIIAKFEEWSYCSVNTLVESEAEASELEEYVGRNMS